MSYSPSPRPTFERTTHIPYRSVTRHLWDDPEAGEVADWIYVSSDRIHQIVFGLEPKGWFRHSDSFRTIFAADDVFYVLSGTMILCNPENGEVHGVERGGVAFFRRDTWHHVFSEGPDELRILEMFAPPPSQGTSGKYAQQQPNQLASRYVRDELLGRWPMDREAIATANTIQVIREPDILWRYEGECHRTLVGLFAATEHLTAGKITLQPGQQTDFHAHGGDESLLVAPAPCSCKGWTRIGRPGWSSNRTMAPTCCKAGQSHYAGTDGSIGRSTRADHEEVPHGPVAGLHDWSPFRRSAGSPD